jgi:ribosomal-protein-alanine N-acetyltransferase
MRFTLVPPEIRSDRLTARPPAPGDVPALHALYRDADAVRWLSPGAEPTEARIVEMVEVDLAHWRAHGFGRWVWCERDSGELVARAGPRLAVVGGCPDVEIHWSVRADRRRRGLAAEAAEAAVRACFDEPALRLDSVTALAHPDNAASHGVMRAVGFAYERPVEYHGAPHAVYRRRRERG